MTRVSGAQDKRRSTRVHRQARIAEKGIDMTASVSGQPSPDNVGVHDHDLAIGGVRFHYRDWGNPAASPVILLHAYLSHARSWDTIAAALSGRFRVLALDQRGHGESDWTTDYHELRLVGDVAQFVDALGLDSFSLVGLSIGGYTACTYALVYPDRVERLVLSECFVEDPFEAQAPAAVSEHISAMRALPAEFPGSAGDASAAAAAAYRPLAPYAEEQELRRWMRGGLMQTTPRTWTWRSDPVLRIPGATGRLNPTAAVLRTRLAAVRPRTLLVVGDTSFHAASARRIAATIPSKPLLQVPAAGHWAPLDNPAGFVEAVRGFLLGEPDPDEAELAYAEY
jgi:esterase